MADVHTVDKVVENIDDLCCNSRYCQFEEKLANRIIAKVGFLPGFCFHEYHFLFIMFYFSIGLTAWKYCSFFVMLNGWGVTKCLFAKLDHMV